MVDLTKQEVFIPTNEEIDKLITNASSIRQAAYENRLKDIPIATVFTMNDVISFLENLKTK